MSARRVSVVLAGLIGAWLTTAVAMADVIEVRGRGFLIGEIISERSDSITFQPTGGGAETFLRRDVTYLEDTGEPARSAAARSDARHGQALGSGLIAETYIFVGNVINTLMAFWFRDPRLVEQVFDVEFTRITLRAQILTDARAAGYAGALFVLMGGLCGVGFACQLIYRASQAGFGWGLAFLASILAALAPYIGGAAGLLFLFPATAAVFFILTRWRIARASVVHGLLSIDLCLLGFVMLRVASSG